LAGGIIYGEVGSAVHVHGSCSEKPRAKAIINQGGVRGKGGMDIIPKTSPRKKKFFILEIRYMKGEVVWTKGGKENKKVSE